MTAVAPLVMQQQRGMAAMNRNDTVGNPVNSGALTQMSSMSLSSPKSPLHVDDSVHSLTSNNKNSTTGDATASFVLPKCTITSRDAYERVDAFVTSAIQEQHKIGSDLSPCPSYDGILQELRHRRDREVLCHVLIALRISDHGLTLQRLTGANSIHTRLLHLLLRFEPFLSETNQRQEQQQQQQQQGEQQPENKDETQEQELPEEDYSIADAYFNLLVAIVTAKSVYLVPVMRSLWQKLMGQSLKSPKGRIFRIHATLATLMRLCPKGRGEMSYLMAREAPYRFRSPSEIEFYFKQCLQVLDYIPSIESTFIPFIVQRCLELDVEIVINDGGDVYIQKEVNVDQNPEQQGQQPVEETRVDVTAEKLDVLMNLLFEYFEGCVARDPTSVYRLYETLLKSFESSILLTHKSKFVQFLLLHICSLEHKFLPSQSVETMDTLDRMFAAKLIDIIVDPFHATVTRQTAACYLASFVSRSSCTCTVTVCEAIGALLRWAEAYLDAQDKLARNNNHHNNASLISTKDDENMFCDLHYLFYAVCQAAYYIMCFRGVEAIQYVQNENNQRATGSGVDATSEFDMNLDQVRWTRICAHRLEPLRFCLESVRTEFLRISTKYNLIDKAVMEERLNSANNKDSIAKRRKRKVVPIQTAATMEKERLSGGVGGLGRGSNPLDSFFPFDPCLLWRSNRYVEPYYNHWKGSHVDGNDEESEADQGDEENHLSSKENAMVCTPSEKDAEDDIDDDDALDNISDCDEMDADEDGDESKTEQEVDGETEDEDDNESINLIISVDKGAGMEKQISNIETTPTTTTGQEEAWGKLLRRRRAPSIETGSW